tara:strand:- start:865 stop:1623 length:759 start_codon:yes stop_codon:yes gene_type:complete
MRVKWSKLLRKGKALYLAYDQGLEHGPSSDFNSKSVDPNYILEIAEKGGFTGVVFHKGIAEKYRKEIKRSKVPLILKLNGKTKIRKGEPVSSVIASVKEAVKLGASAVGFTIYLGSEYEREMIEEFEIIQREAHKKGLPVIVWMYPRGKSVKGKENSGELMAYAARVGLEIGADMVKLRYNGKPKDLAWAVKSAGRCKVVVAGGVKEKEKSLYKDVKGIMNTGAKGMAIGRNVWQSKKPLEVSKELKKIVFG